MSKPAASRGWVCAFCIVPVAIIAVALLVLYPGKRGSAAATVSAASSLSQTVTAPERSRIQASYAALPLAFEQNQGQTDPQVKYLARGNGYTLFLTANDAVFSLHTRPTASESSTAVVHMRLVGGNALAKVEGSGPLPGTANYFLGNDPSKWRSGVARYAHVSYQNVYPGVNMAFHGAQRELEFDFVLAPGANPAPIGFQVTGNQGVKTDASGNLILSSAAGDVLLHKPVAYQEQDGTRQPVDARFVLRADNRVSFDLGNYDRSRELVIDPSVSYATYLGGLGADEGLGIAFDGSGNAYVTGETASTNFPGVSNVLRGAGTTDAFVTKIAADGSSLIYSTYVGGNGNDSGNSIAVDASGDAFVAGGTTSTDLVTSPGAFQAVLKGIKNAFVFELSPGGSTLIYNTYLGGTGADIAQGVAVDSSGNSYVVGSASSTNFPTHNPLQTYPVGTTNNGFVTKLNSSGSALVYSTYLALGGATGDTAKAVAVDSSGNAYVTGAVSGTSFVTTSGVFQPTCGTAANCNGGLSDAFVTVIKPDGSGYVYSTFLGGGGSDVGFSIAVESSGSGYVTGSTSSSTDFPVKTPALQGSFGGGNIDAFVTKLNPTGTGLVYSTYLGGSGDDTAKGIAVDGIGNAYITGQTNSDNFKTVTPTQSTRKGGYDAFVSEFNAAGSQLTFSTYLGGTGDEDNGGNFGAIAVDSGGANIYVTGSTASTDFPTTSGVTQPVTGGGNDAFVAKFAQSPTGSTFSLAATALSPASVSPGGSATSTVTVTSTNGFTGTVNLGCSVSPSVTHGPTCSGSATPGAPGTLTVSTTAASALLQHPQTGNASRVFFAMFLPIGGMALLSFGFAGPRRKKLFGGFLFCLALVALFLLPACGGGSGGGGGGSSGTPAGNYTITVSGTATGSSQTGASPSLTLTVN